MHQVHLSITMVKVFIGVVTTVGELIHFLSIQAGDKT
jgi:hypothetical protein